MRTSCVCFFTTTTPSTLGCPLLKVTRDFFNHTNFSTSTQLMNHFVPSTLAVHLTFVYLVVKPLRSLRLSGLNFFTTTTPSTLGCPLLKVTRDFFNHTNFSTSTQLMNRFVTSKMGSSFNLCVPCG
jgi:hypothetical protein